MKPEDIIKNIENLPEKTKNVLYSAMFSLFMGMKNVEQESFDVQALPDSIETPVQMKQNLLEMFRDGVVNEQTKQYKQHFYKILEKADQIAKEKFGDQYFSNDQQSIESNGLFKRMNENASYNERNNITTIKNKVSLLNYDYEITGEAPRYASTLKIGRHIDNKLKLEYLTDQLSIRNIDNTNFVLSFIINVEEGSSYNEQNIKKLTTDIHTVSFYKDYKEHTYRFLTFDSIMMNKNMIYVNFKSRR